MKLGYNHIDSAALRGNAMLLFTVYIAACWLILNNSVWTCPLLAALSGRKMLSNAVMAASWFFMLTQL